MKLEKIKVAKNILAKNDNFKKNEIFEINENSEKKENVERVKIWKNKVFRKCGTNEIFDKGNFSKKRKKEIFEKNETFEKIKISQK